MVAEEGQEQVYYDPALWIHRALPWLTRGWILQAMEEMSGWNCHYVSWMLEERWCLEGKGLKREKF